MILLWLKKSEFLRFLLAGFVNSFITYLLFIILQIFIRYQLAYTFVYILGILLSYWLNSVFVFKKNINLKKAIQYPLVYLIQYLSGVLVLTLLVDWMHFNAVLAAPIAIIFAIPVTFVLSRTIIKGRKQVVSLNTVEPSITLHE